MCLILLLLFCFIAPFIVIILYFVVSPEISLYTSPSVSSRDTTVVIHCKAIAYPEIDSIELLTRNNEEVEGAQKIISLQRQDNLHYEATLTYTLHNCLPMVYTCLVKNKNRTYNSSSSIGTCQDGNLFFVHKIEISFNRA